jgi:hypothetical protein
MGAITLRAVSMMTRRVVGKRNATTASARKRWCSDTGKSSMKSPECRGITITLLRYFGSVNWDHQAILLDLSVGRT